MELQTPTRERNAAELGRESKFIAKGRNLILVRRPIVQMAHPATGVQMTTPALRYDFSPNGELDIREGVDLLQDGPADDNGVPTEVDAVTWLRGHREFNDRFYELGNEPGQLRPTLEERFEEIAIAAAELNVERLREIRVEEEKSHKRTPIFRAVDSAIGASEHVRATLPPPDDAPAPG